MCKKRGKIIGLVLLGLVAAGAVFAWASPGYCKPFGHHGHWGGGSSVTEDDMKDITEFAVKRFARVSGATAEQKEAIKKELDSRLPKVVELKKKQSDIRDKFLATLNADTVDKAKLEETRKEALALADEASRTALDTLAAVSAILTPEQRKKMLERFKQEHKG